MTAGRALFVLWAAVFAGLAALYLTVPASPDQALFDYIAWSHLHGDVYYGGVAEQNFPGKMFMHEIGLRLFGVHFWSFRAIDALVLAAVSLAGSAILRRADFGLAAWAFLFLYPPLYVTAGYWMAGQRDIVAMGLLLCAAALAVSPDRRPAWASLAAGALIAAAVLMRPTYLSALAGFVVFDWLRFRGEATIRPAVRAGQSLVLFFGFAAVIAGVALYGAWLGVLGDFYQQTILFNLQAYQVPEARLRLLPKMQYLLMHSWHWIAALGVLGALTWARMAGASRELLLAAGLAATVLLSYFVQNKGFDYHLGGLLPVLVLLLPVTLDWLNRWAAWRRVASASLVALALVMVLGTAKKLYNYSENAAALLHGQLMFLQGNPDLPVWSEVTETVRIVREGSAPGSFFLQLGRTFVVPFLAERRTTLKFLSASELDKIGPQLPGYPELVEEIRRNLRDRPPAFALIETRGVPPAALGGGAAPAVRQVVLEALRDYRVVQETPHYMLLQAPR